MGLLITILLVLGVIYAAIAALLVKEGEPLGEALLWPRLLWSLRRLPDERDDL